MAAASLETLLEVCCRDALALHADAVASFAAVGLRDVADVACIACTSSSIPSVAAELFGDKCFEEHVKMLSRAWELAQKPGECVMRHEAKRRCIDSPPVAVSPEAAPGAAAPVVLPPRISAAAQRVMLKATLAAVSPLPACAPITVAASVPKVLSS